MGSVSGALGFGRVVICCWILVLDLVFVFGLVVLGCLFGVFAGLLRMFVGCLLVCGFRCVGMWIAVCLFGGVVCFGVAGGFGVSSLCCWVVFWFCLLLVYCDCGLVFGVCLLCRFGVQ